MTGWLKRHALTNQRDSVTRTMVVHRSNRVVGYHSLAAGAVSRQSAPERVSEDLPGYPIPVFLLARLAVDKTEQGNGLGKALVKNALLKAEQALELVAARAILVHALHEEAARFYEHLGFERSPTDPLHLYLRMDDVRAWLAQIREESTP